MARCIDYLRAFVLHWRTSYIFLVPAPNQLLRFRTSFRLVETLRMVRSLVRVPELVPCWWNMAITRTVQRWNVMQNKSHAWIYCLRPPPQESAVQQQQPVAIETPTEHTTYSYQHNKWGGGRGGLWSLKMFVRLCVSLYVYTSQFQNFHLATLWTQKDTPQQWLPFLIGWCCFCVRSSSGAGVTLKGPSCWDSAQWLCMRGTRHSGGVWTVTQKRKKRDIFYKLIF